MIHIFLVIQQDGLMNVTATCWVRHSVTLVCVFIRVFLVELEDVNDFS